MLYSMSESSLSLLPPLLDLPPPPVFLFATGFLELPECVELAAPPLKVRWRVFLVKIRSKGYKLWCAYLDFVPDLIVEVVDCSSSERVFFSFCFFRLLAAEKPHSNDY